MSLPHSFFRILLGTAAVLLPLSAACGQPGTEAEPVRYVGSEEVDPDVHEGGFRPAIGVANHQTLRVNRTHPELAEGYGWTYNHASNLAHWRGRFYQQYLSNPVDEHIAPGQTLIVNSTNGRDWDKPVVVFPPYEPPAGIRPPEGYGGYMMHQRMGFHVTSEDRLLVLGFYGHSEEPFGQGGIGRVVREAYEDGTYGPIYFIRYTSHADWNAENTAYPFYTASPDRGFVEACEELLSDPLRTFQWWDEDRGLDGFHGDRRGGSALSYYHRKDGAVVALWKRSRCALSFDEGITFSDPTKAPTLIMAGAKAWGQRTDDGRYALVYNPIELDEHRYPLIAIAGDDGVLFDDMVLVQGEIPPRRFYGRWKDFGPQYVRGIAEGNGNPPGEDFWLTYSMNKEDMWVARVPLPVRHKVEGDVDDNFDEMETDGNVTDWNLYEPKWAPVDVVDFPSAQNKSLRLTDKDPSDYARAVRVFEEGTRARLEFKVLAQEKGRGTLEIDVVDHVGRRPVRIELDGEGKIKANDGDERVSLASFKSGEWISFGIDIDLSDEGSYNLVLDGEEVSKGFALAEEVESVERISFRTGPWRNHPTRETPNQDPAEPLPGADDPVEPAVFYLDEVRLATSNGEKN